jgi:uncharacterized iron-regulated protein
MSKSVLVLAAALAGCGGGYAKATPGPKAPASEVKGVEAAALPFRVLRARGGQELDTAAFYREVAAAQAVCIGETHPNPHDHWAQLQIVDQVTAAARTAGLELALGMEMFQRPFQGVLDDYVAGRIDEAALLSRSGWEDRWGYDYALYRPMVTLAVTRGARLLALNTARELTKKVARQGLDTLTPSERAELPQLVLDDPDHRAWWDAVMGSMGGAHGHGSGHGHGDDTEVDPEEAAASAERIYTAQVLWDETMAEVAAGWLAAGQGRQVIILAGNGHCHDSGIVARMRRRGVTGVVSIRPLVDSGDGTLADLVASPENDYLFVMSMPADAGGAR